MFLLAYFVENSYFQIKKLLLMYKIQMMCFVKFIIDVDLGNLEV